MRINNNLMAMNSHRQLTANQNAGAKSMERLSSGLRINRAGDDAAGLAISEKMRGQIRGLNQASRNAQDGISLIQTAEGALNESHAILQRMRELAVQSANDTNVQVDRDELQKEVDQLAAELTRIGDTTEFNTQTLLDGDLSVTFQIGANEGQNIELSIEDMRAFDLGVAGDASFETTGAHTAATGDGNDTIVEGTHTIQETDTGYEMVSNDGTVLATSDDGITYTGTDAGTGTADTLVFDHAVTSGEVTVAADLSATGTASVSDTGLEPGTYTVSSDQSTITDASGDVVATWDGTSEYVDADGNTVIAGGGAANDQQLAADAQITVGGIDISSQTAADKAVTDINSAIEEVSAQRSELGAYQNRLEHTIENLGTSSENLQAAESRIRDLDMAAEMMDFTKSNILNQAATAMLAQANQAPQSVLQLLG
ncbi:flagellin N-terminal helical domain-containing protein [Natronospora cellulosivora (SeqCode)]